MDLDKKIKRHIYGKFQSVIVKFPAGFGATVLHEIEFILNNLWFDKKTKTEIIVNKNEILINEIHTFALTELLMRCQCISDLRLIVSKGKVTDKFTFAKKCKSIPWNLYINDNMIVKVRANSIASRIYHEKALKEILENVLNESFFKTTSDENVADTTIFVDLNKNKLTISISLAGALLYKKGYRVILSKSAPLREDYASCCLVKAMEFAKKINTNYSPDTLLIPFSGTGTFLFEYLIKYFHYLPIFFGRKYALEKMPLVRQNHLNYLLKTANNACLFTQEYLNKLNMKFICIDTAKNANTALLQNLDFFKKSVITNGFKFPDALFSIDSNDFLKIDITKLGLDGNIFIPLNPPYGIRLGSKINTMDLYKKIALKINELAKLTFENKFNLLGCILCPDQETWLSFRKNLSYAFKTDTSHFTQGGFDIRLCIFYG